MDNILPLVITTRGGEPAAKIPADKPGVMESTEIVKKCEKKNPAHVHKPREDISRMEK